MKSLAQGILKLPIYIIMSAMLLLAPGAASACGGFFCQLLPINQAAEQIVFRQDGNQITAMVQIQFEGDSEDFSWVVPVPSTPEYEVGSNATFTELERITRPQFNLTRTGEECPGIIFAPSPGGPVASVEDGDSNSGVVVESVQDVGGYVVTLISGDNAESITQWLIDNGYDLTQQGRDLLAPYVEDGMKFVAVKLQQNRGIGSIQPLIMKYQSDKPVVPIRLTAVAALEDMGVMVWLLGDARAVPENYLHVTPNYTRLNWLSGTRNAYASYQTLITEAMNEAGGQGFATDYAGRFENLLDALTSASELEAQLDRLSASTDVEYISLVQNFFQSAVVTDALTRALPLQEDLSTFMYFDQNFLTSNYTSSELAAARQSVDAIIRTDVIAPTQASLAVLAGDRYMTRLYTTLSADEMTLDPAFVFNSDMAGQPLDRNATLNASCIDDITHWTLKLGEGTGRNGEVVIDTIGPIPFLVPPIAQPASWKLEQTTDIGQPTVQLQRSFPIESFGSPGNATEPTPVGDCIDTDGDGWGWDGQNSCRLEPVANETTCIDLDGDGWGWDGENSCRLEPVASETTCIDSDGDGWGWDGTASCLIDTAPPTDIYAELPCIDSDGDGWGWQQPQGQPELGRSCVAQD